jgi:RND family efflux transporter MFP subunit
MRFCLVVLTVSLSGLLLAGCKAKPNGGGPQGPPEVKVSEVETRKVIDYEYFTGRIEAYQKADLRARVTGYLEEIKFKDGDLVKKGQLLFVIDQRLFKAQVANAKATLAQSEAHLKRVEADYNRAAALFERGGIGREDFERYRGDRDESQAATDAARASLKIAQQNLDYTEIRAPFSGRMSRRMIDIGNDVKQDDMVLSSIVNLEKVYAYFDVDERTLLRQLVSKGSLETARAGKVKIDIGLADEDGYPHKGTVDFVDNTVDPNTGTMWLRGTFDKQDRVLTPGVFVRVRFPVGLEHDAILVAEQAISTDQGQKFVYVLDDKNHAQYCEVKVGRLEGGLRVITDGLKPGKKVVVSGLQRIRGNAEVKPLVVPMPVRTAEASGGR